jgi:uncharacterized protein (DUF2062 family)
MLYPRGGWLRAFHYVKHRVRRLPDSPERIARGIGAGVFTTFTPFYGLHFPTAWLISRGLGGNGLAALMATFFGNPLTYVPIGAVSLKTGHFLLGTEFQADADTTLLGKFVDAWVDLKNNALSLLYPHNADWSGLQVFWHDVFFPYLVGGILPGIVCSVTCYYLSVPVLHAYQNRKRARIKAKFEKIKKRAEVDDSKVDDSTDRSKGDAGLSPDVTPNPDTSRKKRSP